MYSNGQRDSEVFFFCAKAGGAKESYLSLLRAYMYIGRGWEVGRASTDEPCEAKMDWQV